MSIPSRLKISHGEVFPHGAYVIGDVEAVRDWEKSTPQRAVQAVDKESGLLVWAVSVLDADPDARKDAKTVTVKIQGWPEAIAERRAAPLTAPGRPADSQTGRGEGMADPALQRILDDLCHVATLRLRKQ